MRHVKWSCHANRTRTLHVGKFYIYEYLSEQGLTLRDTGSAVENNFTVGECLSCFICYNNLYLHNIIGFPDLYLPMFLFIDPFCVIQQTIGTVTQISVAIAKLLHFHGETSATNVLVDNSISWLNTVNVRNWPNFVILLLCRTRLTASIRHDLLI